MNRTLDLDADFFGSAAMPLICLATSATDDVSLYTMELRSDPDRLAWQPVRRRIVIPYTRAVQARIRLHNRLFFAAGALSVVGAVGLVGAVAGNAPMWIGKASLILLAAGWLTVGLFALFSGAFAPQITLIDGGRTVRIVFPKKGEMACEVFRLAHMKWRGEQGETGGAMPADDWADEVKTGWDEGQTEQERN
ncbi:MAG TPA: hypothetical protein VL860_05360 [Planctomycetota bacterium]|nr:hypothetical protein [Planctomycetota bacterium]